MSPSAAMSPHPRMRSSARGGPSGGAYLAVRGILALEHRGVTCVVRALPRERVRVCPARPASGLP
jgi:hypothetical protein